MLKFQGVKIFQWCYKLQNTIRLLRHICSIMKTVKNVFKCFKCARTYSANRFCFKKQKCFRMLEVCWNWSLNNMSNLEVFAQKTVVLLRRYVELANAIHTSHARNALLRYRQIDNFGQRGFDQVNLGFTKATDFSKKSNNGRSFGSVWVHTRDSTGSNPGQQEMVTKLHLTRLPLSRATGASDWIADSSRLYSTDILPTPFWN